jgi:hypothetical protein
MQVRCVSIIYYMMVVCCELVAEARLFVTYSSVARVRHLVEHE